MSMKDEIFNMERETWEALKNSGSALLPYVTNDCVMLFPGGAFFSATSDPPLRDILTRSDMKPWMNYEMRKVTVLELGHDAASISYDVEASREGLDFRALITSIWRREGAAWKMCLHQQTLV